MVIFKQLFLLKQKEVRVVNRDEINKRIQQENSRHQRVMLELDKKKTKEKEHHQREIEYWQNQKAKCSKAKIKEKYFTVESFDSIINAAYQN